VGPTDISTSRHLLPGSGDPLSVADRRGPDVRFLDHPYLQTEELANEIALRVVSRESLDEVYEKVWKRTGTTGDLVYLPVK
jgi:hypothetical protein